MGATEQGRYLVVMCLECRDLQSFWKQDEASLADIEQIACRKCGKALMRITDDGAWGPSTVRNMFPDYEPWLVEDALYSLQGEPTVEHLEQLKDMWILCPMCRTHSLEYETEALWD